MKVETNKAFTPIILTITIESEEERDMMNKFFGNCCKSTVNTWTNYELSSAFTFDESQHAAIRKLMDDIYEATEI